MLNGKPLICISSDMKKMESDPRRLITETYQTYSDAVFYAGGIPMITCGCCAEEMADLCDGLLITGGPDLEPEVYGEQPLNDTVKPMPERTAFEKPLFQAFLDRGKPILGICRGCQFINAVMGGTLYQDLVSKRAGCISTPRSATRSMPRKGPCCTGCLDRNSGPTPPTTRL